ncbi:MAG TPA: GNAT family N-acetyltransferase [Gaiellaceae bacterium]|nr:GNAT family N-acetyltransferase [Gaiellaceae bacterium]
MHIRAATLDDVERLAAFMGRCTVVHQGVSRASVGEMRQRLTKPGSDPALDTWLVEGEGGEIAGFAEVWSEEPHTEVVCYVRVDPECTGQGIATALLDRAAARAVELTPPGRQTVLHATSWPKDDAAVRFLEGSGFAPVRYFLLMTADLDEPLEPPEWPAGVDVRALRQDSDLAAVYEAQAAIFRDHWGSTPSFDEWLHEYTGDGTFDPTLWFLADDAEGIAGFVLCVADFAEDPEAGYVGELGVRPDRRGEGLGLALLRHAFAEFARRGKRRVSLHVDAENLSGALRLYARAGMRSDPRIVVWERKLEG